MCVVSSMLAVRRGAKSNTAFGVASAMLSPPPPPRLQLEVPTPTGPCKGDISFDDREIGLNNQLASLSYMLCAARGANMCSVYAPPLGYKPCGVHLPGTRDRNGCHIVSNATVDLLDILKLDPSDELMLRRGAALGESFRGMCRKEEKTENGGRGCETCGPYNANPYRCMRNAIDKPNSARQHMLYAYGLKYHQRSRRRPDHPDCPLMNLTLAPSVEAYARSLMERLDLLPGRFVAAQFRTGWAWRVHTFKNRFSWGCYGMNTLNTKLERLRDEAMAADVMPASTAAKFEATMPSKLFLLTNERNIHQKGVPVPIQVLSEMRIASLAHTLLLNPMSSFQDAIRQLRGNARRVFYVERKDIIKNDLCGCTAADELPLRGHALLQREELCSNATLFKDWLSGALDTEQVNLARRRARFANQTSTTAVAQTPATSTLASRISPSSRTGITGTGTRTHATSTRNAAHHLPQVHHARPITRRLPSTPSPGRA